MHPMVRYPKTPDTSRSYNQKMETPDFDIPSNELTEDSIKNLDVVWGTIKELAPKWIERKKAGICAPNYPISRKDYWTEFSEKCNPTSFIQLDQFLESVPGRGKTAIDIGSNKGFISKKLLEHGWKVIALDKCFKALEMLAENNKANEDHLTLVCKSITKYTPDQPVDLVICKDVFPYINPSKFQTVWEKIYHLFLKKNGYLIGTIFSADQDPTKLVAMNQLKEIGAWFVPDKRLILPMIEGTGYKIETTANSIHQQLEKGPRLVFQFSAQKI